MEKYGLEVLPREYAELLRGPGDGEKEGHNILQLPVPGQVSRPASGGSLRRRHGAGGWLRKSFQGGFKEDVPGPGGQEVPRGVLLSEAPLADR